MALLSLLAPATAGDAVDTVMGGDALDPMTGAMISAGSNVLGKALGGSAGPSRADSGGQNWFDFDHSGWTVATGGSKADAVAGLAVPSWAWVAVAIVAVVWVKQKKA